LSILVVEHIASQRAWRFVEVDVPTIAIIAPNVLDGRLAESAALSEADGDDLARNRTIDRASWRLHANSLRLPRCVTGEADAQKERQISMMGFRV
jgi:hypothetical protein